MSIYYRFTLICPNLLNSKFINTSPQSLLCITKETVRQAAGWVILSFMCRVWCKHPHVWYIWGEFWCWFVLGWFFFSYSTIVCLSALRNLSLHLPLRIHQLVLVNFSPVFPFETSVPKKRTEEQKEKKRERKGKEEKEKGPFSIISWTILVLITPTAWQTVP